MKERRYNIWEVIVCLSSLFVVVIALSLIIYVIYGEISGARWRHRHRVFLTEVSQLKGKKEQFVLMRLGEPSEAITVAEAKRRGGRYQWEGWEQPQRPVGHKVLIYAQGDVIGYIYINKSGIVEDVFCGRS